MPFLAVPSVKRGVTVSPPVTALSSVTVKVRESPSAADASATVTAGSAPSSSVMVPVAVSVAVTVVWVPETVRSTVKVSSFSTSASSVVATVKDCVSPRVPMKVMGAVFAV